MSVLILFLLKALRKVSGSSFSSLTIPSLQHGVLEVHHRGRKVSHGPRAGEGEAPGRYLPRAICSVTVGSLSPPLLLHLFLLSMYQHRHTCIFPLRSWQRGWLVRWLLDPPISRLPKVEHPLVCAISYMVYCTAAGTGTPATGVWISFYKMWACTNETDVIFTSEIVDN